MSNKDLYINICEQRKDLPLFLQYWWLDLVCKKWDIAIAKNGDHIAGVWPYQIENKMGISLRRSPVLTPYLGPYVFFPPDLKETKRDNFEHETISTLLKEMPDSKVWNVSLQPGIKQVGLFKETSFEVLTRQTFIMNLQADETSVFANLHEDYRRNIRKADNELTITDDPSALTQLYEFQKATLDRKNVNMHFSFQQMQGLFNACRERGNTALWVAKKDGVIQAILWHLWDDVRAYYLVGSKNPAIKDNRAMTALIWHAMKESLKSGKSSFDFEGSMDPGVEHFFRNFGGSRELYLVLKKNDSLLWKIKEKIR